MITSDVRQGAEPTPSWRQAIAHRPTHSGNAALVAQSLASGTDTPATRLVAANAALIVHASSPGLDMNEAANRVRHTLRSGRAERFLTTLTHSR
jgi:anthranilate phosphoribosyltransferase